MLPLAGMLAQQAHHLGEHLRRGLVAGNQELLDDAQHLGHRQVISLGVVDAVGVPVDPGVEQVRQQVFLR